MKQYERFLDYVLFDQLESDFIGDNHRAGKTVNRKVTQHMVISRIHPYFLEDGSTWNRIKILLEGVKKSNIPHLHSPAQIDAESETPYLAYPLLKAKSFEKVMRDAAEKDIPINFDLAMSIAISIAELIDMGSSIVVSGQRSFHGFLTPDNILIDGDGKIYLKNYGIACYLNYSDPLFEALSRKYGSLMTPEFIKREKLTAQSDIYHLGYLVYKMLTGTYFSYTEGEDFDTKFANISFSSYVPTTDKDFLTGIITFFKKTLNPDPALRFSNIKEFKDFISRYFHIEELSSVTFNLAYFINSIYDEEDEAMAKIYAQELTYIIPEEKKPEPVAPVVDSRHLVEDILTGLDEKEKSSKGLWMGLAGVAVVIIAVIMFMVMQSKSAAEAARKALEAQKIESQRLIDQMKKDSDSVQAQIESMMAQTAQTAEEQKKKDEQIANLKKEQDRIVESRKVEEEKQKTLAAQKAQEDIKQQEADAASRQQEEARKAAEMEELRKKEESARLEEERRNRVPKLGELLDLSEVEVQPKRIQGENPSKFSSDVRKAHKGKTIKITIRLLIDEKGSISKTEVLPRELDSMLRLEISQATSVWKFEPAKKKNVAVKVWFVQNLDLTF
jgi:serine/threonine protein kinase